MNRRLRFLFESVSELVVQSRCNFDLSKESERPAGNFETIELPSMVSQYDILGSRGMP